MSCSRLGILAMVVGLAGALAAPALAAPVIPPDNSALNQYRETLPAPSGSQPTDSGGDRTPAQVLGRDNAKKLEQLGSDGRAAAALAAATAPAGVAGGKAKGQRGGGAVDSGDGSSTLGEILGQAIGPSSSGEMGLLLPLAIVAAIVAAIAYAVARRRGAHSS
jgi:hypothetical protein